MTTESSQSLTHLTSAGEAHMVDVGQKPTTRRSAVAHATVEAQADTVTAIRKGSMLKGDVLAVARIAGIMAAKRTSELIPLCHQLPLSSVEIDIELRDESIQIVAEAHTVGQTGVEMEALTAASIAALTVYDMCKAIDRGMAITNLELLSKSGGRSGDWSRR